MKKNLVHFFLLLVFLVSISFSVEASQNPANKKFIVVIDAGHGGKDSGNSWHGFKEKHIALDIALKVGKALEAKENIKVIYTRKTDVFIPLHKRAEIANSANADLFVSVHCNGHDSNAHGTETFVLGLHRSKDNLEIAMKENSVIYLEENYEVKYDGFDPNDPASYMGMTLMQEEYLDQSVLLADFIQKEYTGNLKRVDRGVKQAGFLVLRETYMPSVLTEVGFLSYKPEGSYLNSSKGKGEVSKSIVNGIKDYINSINLYNNEANTAPKKSEIYEDVTFKVQLAAGSTPLETAPYNFKGLTGVTREKEGKLYKYYVGETSDYLAIQAKQRLAKEKGYSSCYIVAFRKGKKISVNEALKTKAK
ncbi:N-acetylmuramoyl-L-alanine amidase family protein [Mesonia aquimarina]|uniref:N-acetylmuramoyl-L-alanine amidase family protein n=1 Tax=Mesonia aquimarina TaxID=1504967 RepID=UPI000EF5A079|nr:N-acetylmuramoyl-L-alanine amidase [Mesonia aquimarina]